MSCHGKTDFHANDESLTWQEFKTQTLAIGATRDDRGFMTYLQEVTDNAWAHVVSENFLTPQNAEAKLWGYYCTDVKDQ